MENLPGKIAVVTGGASGIGKAICRALLDEGVTVVIADVEEGAIAGTVDELTSHGKVTASAPT
jgi:NAD(P)-dependent dehydrogenase (short-subunit alcohol dehydrogenase family)